MIYNLDNNLERINDYQNQMASGKKIDKPSDDPVLASRVLKYRSDLSQLDMFEQNAEDARSWMDITESSVNDAIQTMQRIRELTVKAASGVYTLEEKETIASEIEELRDHIIQDGNTNYAGRYVFSNYYTDEPLFNDDGTYNIPMTSQVVNTREPIIYGIAVGEEMDVNTSPVDVFGYVQTTDALYSDIPDGSGVGTAATKAVKSGTFDLNRDFSTGVNDDATIDIVVDGTTYTIQSADLTGMIAGSANPHEKGDITNLFNNADDGGGNLLETVADVYFDPTGALTIKSKTYGVGSNVNIAYNGDSGGGLTAADLQAAVGIAPGADVGTDITDPVIFDAAKTIDPAGFADPLIVQEYRDNTFVLTLNGETKEIQLDPADPLTSVADLSTAVQNAIDAAFPGPEVAVTVAGGPAPNEYLSFTTVNQPNDGDPPELQIETVQATESQLISDINNLITDLRNDENSDVLTTHIGFIDVDLNRMLTAESDIGARNTRVELVLNRIGENNLTYTSLMSEAQDADMAEVIMHYQNAQNVYRASLSTGAQTIQPTLIDFIR